MTPKLACLLIANLCAALPALGQADDLRLGGSVSVGGIRVDDKDTADASKLNEYRDLSSGTLLLFDVKGRAGRYWFDAFGENLGRDDQYLDFRGGMYDLFKVRVYSDALKHNFLFNGITPYAGAGSATATATFPSLNPAAWNSLDVGYKRRDTGTLFEWQGAAPWYARVDANQVKWSGSKPGASSQGMSPSNGFVDLAFPVDYTTRNATVEAGYNTKAMHFDLSWMTSKFENDQESITWTNGYFGGGTDRTYLAPDNRYTRVAGNATFRQLPLGSTFAARFTSDELKSSASLGDTVLNGTAGQIAATGANASTFDGRIRNETLTLALASTPAKGLDTRVYYNFRKRDDDSTQLAFTSAAIPGPIENELFSYRKNNYGLEATYRINRGNRLGAGLDDLDTKREGRFDYDRTRDRRYFAEWKNTSLDALSARLKYTRLQRRSDFLLGNDGASASDVDYLNRFVTAFDLSNVDQDQVKLTLDYSPMPLLDLSFEGIAKNNKYKDNVLGRLTDDRREYYASASYGEAAGPRITVFADAEEIRYDSQHRIIGSASTAGAYDPLAPPTAANYDWRGRIKDRNWALGFAVDWPASEKLVLRASAIYYKTDGSVDLALQDGTPASVVRPLPIASWDDSRKTSISLKAVYTLSKTWAFTGGYAYEKYDYRDAQFEGYRNTIPAATGQNSYLDGVYANPQYKANMVYGLVSYRF